MLTQLPSVPSLIPSSFATRAIGRDVSITIFTASSLNSGEKLFFGRGNYFTFPDAHPIGWTVRKARGTSVTYAGAEFWDQFFRRRLESGSDLDWEGLWTEPFLVPLREAGVRTILELGCGTGHDAARLADAGYSVTAIDLSGEEVGQAPARLRSPARSWWSA